MSSNALESLSEWLEQHPRLLIVTGAGISLASGIPTFRGSEPGAIWANDVLAKGTHAYFKRNPVESLSWYLSRFTNVLEAAPNPAHHALARLEDQWIERGDPFLLVTQNVDTLHEQAGSSELVKVHGTADRLRCARNRCQFGKPFGSIPRAEVDVDPFLRDPCMETLPRCSVCDDLLRPHVLWFDERYDEHHDYQIDRVVQNARSADLILFIGTSFAVGVTDLVRAYGSERSVPMFSIDPSAHVPDTSVIPIVAKAEDLLPEIVATLDDRSRAEVD